MPPPAAKQTVALSAPGKVLLAGGYLVLDRRHTGLVFGLSARINVVASEIKTGDGVQLAEVVVESPQFLDAQWRYGYHMAAEGGGIGVTQLQTTGSEVKRNLFVETTLSFALTYIDQLRGNHPDHSMSSSRLIILADNDYYSQTSSPDTAKVSGRFAKFPVSLSGANKTGLGSSAALVTSLTAALLTHYLPTDLFDVGSERGRRSLHNLAQAAHCAAQGKVGSGFDVAAAVYGSCQYRRFSPSVLDKLPEAGSPGFGEKLVAVVDSETDWDVEVEKNDLRMPEGVALRMCDVDCGSQTVGMVKKVLSWRTNDSERATALWDELQTANDELASTLRRGDAAALPGKLNRIRELIRDMGRLSDVPIEPDTQTELLDAVSTLDGVYGGVVPGAGGFDALALLMRDDEETKRRVEDFLRKWSEEKRAKVRLLDVKGEVEGVLREDMSEVYREWI